MRDGEGLDLSAEWFQWVFPQNFKKGYLLYSAFMHFGLSESEDIQLQDLKSEKRKQNLFCE